MEDKTIAKAALAVGLAALWQQSKSLAINPQQQSTYGQSIMRVDFSESRVGAGAGTFVTPYNRQGFTALTSAPLTWGVTSPTRPIKKIGFRVYSTAVKAGDSFSFAAQWYLNGVFYSPPALSLTIPNSYPGLGVGWQDTGLLDVTALNNAAVKPPAILPDSDFLTISETFLIGPGTSTLLGYAEIYGAE